MSPQKNGVAAHPSAPVVAKLRMRYAKRGRARFSSHRDVARSMEWSLRRAGVPVALSQGFSPHPRLSWIGAVPTGAASEAEYVEIGITADLAPETVGHEVHRVLPGGLAVVEVVMAGPGALADRIDSSRWRLDLPRVAPEDLERAVGALLAADAAPVERMTKNGLRTLDVRAGLVTLGIEAGDEEDTPGGGEWQRRAPSAACGRLSAVVRHTTPAVRPDDVLSALRSVAGLRPPVPAMATRLAQGRLDDRGELLDPLAADRGATAHAIPDGGHGAADRTV